MGIDMPSRLALLVFPWRCRTGNGTLDDGYPSYLNGRKGRKKKVSDGVTRSNKEAESKYPKGITSM